MIPVTVKKGLIRSLTRVYKDSNTDKIYNFLISNNPNLFNGFKCTDNPHDSEDKFSFELHYRGKWCYWEGCLLLKRHGRTLQEN